MRPFSGDRRLHRSRFSVVPQTSIWSGLPPEYRREPFAMSAIHLAASAVPGAAAFADAPRSYGYGDGPDRTPLIRFLSPSAFTGHVARCPVQPATGRSRFGVAARLISVTGTHRDGPSGGRSPLRSFASAPTARPSANRPLRRPVILDRCHIGAARDRSCIAHFRSRFRRCSATCPTSLSQPGRGSDRRLSNTCRTRVPATLLGFLPFAVLLLPVAFEAFPLRHPHVPLSNQPPQSVFHRGTGRPDLMDLRLDRSNRSSCAPGRFCACAIEAS
jgi:hypothetical protein